MFFGTTQARKLLLLTILVQHGRITVSPKLYTGLLLKLIGTLVGGGFIPFTVYKPVIS